MDSIVSLDTLEDFCQRFWKAVGEANVFAFHGRMGAGKTTIISALCRARGTKDVTGSPTFSIINEYITTNGEKLFHIDLYRLRDDEEVMNAGVEDCIDSGAPCMVEWPEKAPYLFDELSVHVFVEPISATERRVRVQPGGRANGA